LDDIRAHVGEELRAGRARLYVGEVEDAHAVERLAGLAERLARRFRQAVAVLLCDQLHDLLRFRRRFLRSLPGGLFRRLLLRLGHLLSPLSLLPPMPAKAGIQSLALGPRFRGDERHVNYFFFSLLCGFRLPMRPLSLPAAGSITALISVGLPESIAAFTARLSSSGDVALTPTPPNASIILS